MVPEPERRPEPEPPVSIPSVRRDDHELEEELVPVRPVPSVPDVEETSSEPAPALQELGADAEQELDPVPDIKELEEGTPRKKERKSARDTDSLPMYAPSFWTGKTWTPPARKKKPDPS
ncbi:MAG: hypothetical protein ACLT8E_09585 [Akkermansia sp.]